MASATSPWRSNVPSPITAQESYQCSYCPRSFKRHEHLKRHQRGHESEKQFVCGSCSKAFSRSDILQRHEFIHTIRSSSSSLNKKRRRACTECAKARERCSRSEPCLRCSNKLLSCLYPPERSEKSVVQRNVPSSLDQETGLVEQYLLPSQQQVDKILDPRAIVAACSHGRRPQISQPSPLVRDMSLQETRIHSDGDIVISDAQTPCVLINTQNPTTYMEASTPFSLVQQRGLSDETMNYPINWLPSNDSIGFDYSSTLGLNIDSYTSLGDFSSRVPMEVLVDESTTDFLHHYTALSTNEFARAPKNYAPDPPVNQSAVCPVSTIDQSAGMSPSFSQSPGSALSVSTSSTQGALYATSTDGARVPCTARSKRPNLPVYGATPMKSILDANALDDEHHADLKFPSLDGIHLEGAEDHQSHPMQINSETYEIIKHQFEKLCLTQGGLYSPYVAPNFPSLTHLNVLIGLYFERFDSMLPIIHHETNLNESWLLSLAISAIGCQYVDTEEFSYCVRPFHEFVRRALSAELEWAVSWARCSLTLMQAFFLSQVGMMYHGSPTFSRKAQAMNGTLIEIVKCAGLLKNSPVILSPDNEDGVEQERRWKSWVLTETRKRLGYSVWLLGCMSVYHIGRSSAFSLDTSMCELPNEELWRCKTSDEWASRFRVSKKTPSLSTAICQLFLDKRAEKNFDEFATLLLLHAIYQEIYHVQGYLGRSLSSWVPSIQRQADSIIGVGEHLQGSHSADSENRSRISNWRNAALDCVDVLHWAANATIATAAGVEHPTVLHLHMARVVLLAPYRSIQSLAKSIACLSPNSKYASLVSRSEAAQAEHDVLRWAQGDEHKARLAVLHCGCFFWHIRRYSRDAFYEPISVFLTTLTLWAYSSYASRTDNQEQNNHTIQNLAGGSEDIHSGSKDRQRSPEASNRFDQHDGNEHNPQTRRREDTHMPSDFDDDGREPTFIRLDRPNDDEMVQLFVRSGRPYNMRAHITGVGDICSSQGPAKILREGRKILGSVSSAWGRTKNYISLLEAVERVSMDSTHV